MQWFRFYTEAISDKKLRRIARDNNESMAHVIGVWTIVLAMASDSPQRGKLLISDDVPATIDDIADAAGCNVTATFQKLLVTGLVTVTCNNVYEVPAWDKRQFDSDNSTKRVQELRERRKSAKKDENETLQQRSGNAPDTDTDTDTEGVNKVTKKRAPKKPSESDLPPELAAQFHDMFAAICETCELSPRVNPSKTGGHAKTLLRAGYTPEQVRGFKAWWQSDQWRLEHTPVPTVAKMIEKMEQFKNSIGKPRPIPAANGNGYHANGVPSKVDKTLANAAALREMLKEGGTL